MDEMNEANKIKELKKKMSLVEEKMQKLEKRLIKINQELDYFFKKIKVKI